jgi:ankyrin repeat protein
MGNTALMRTAAQGNLQVVRVLVQSGADKEKRNQVSVEYFKVNSNLTRCYVRLLLELG